MDSARPAVPCALRQPVPGTDRLPLKALAAALVAWDYPLAEALTDVLLLMVPGAERRVRAHFRADGDLRRESLRPVHSRGKHRPEAPAARH